MRKHRFLALVFGLMLSVSGYSQTSILEHLLFQSTFNKDFFPKGDLAFSSYANTTYLNIIQMGAAWEQPLWNGLGYLGLEAGYSSGSKFGGRSSMDFIPVMLNAGYDIPLGDFFSVGPNVKLGGFSLITPIGNKLVPVIAGHVEGEFRYKPFPLSLYAAGGVDFFPTVSGVLPAIEVGTRFRPYALINRSGSKEKKKATVSGQVATSGQTAPVAVPHSLTVVTPHPPAVVPHSLTVVTPLLATVVAPPKAVVASPAPVVVVPPAPAAVVTPPPAPVVVAPPKPAAVITPPKAVVASQPPAPVAVASPAPVAVVTPPPAPAVVTPPKPAAVVAPPPAPVVVTPPPSAIVIPPAPAAVVALSPAVVAPPKAVVAPPPPAPVVTPPKAVIAPAAVVTPPPPVKTLGGMPVVIDGRQCYLRSVYFHPDNDVIIDASRSSLDAVGRELAADSALRLSLRAYTTPAKTPEGRFAVSVDRAAYCQEYLYHRYGISSNRITSYYYGSDRSPLMANGNLESLRCVELIVR